MASPPLHIAISTPIAYNLSVLKKGVRAELSQNKNELKFSCFVTKVKILRELERKRGRRRGTHNVKKAK